MMAKIWQSPNQPVVIACPLDRRTMSIYRGIYLNYPMLKSYYVYIMTNKYNTVLYTGVTNDLERRVFQHKTNAVKGFTSKYKCTKLVYYAETDDISVAITEEKRIKGGSREKKIALIESMNPDWNDLAGEWFDL